MRTKLFLLAFFVPFFVHAQKVAVVNVSAASMYLAPDYESALETQELMGVPLAVTDTSRYWLKAISPQPYEAWITDRTVVLMDEEEFQAYQHHPKYLVTGLWGTVFTNPRHTSAPLCDIVAGDILRMDMKGGKAVCRNGFCHVLLPDGRAGWVKKDLLADMDRWQKEMEGLGAAQRIERAIDFAQKLVGVPYLWGGMSTKGMDCSGLVRLSYLMAKLELPRNASEQFYSGSEIPVGRNADGSFDLSALKRGDLVFFGTETPEKLSITHVGIYLGDNRMIQSSHYVRINSLQSSDPDCYENAWKLLRACRPLED